ncbi:MAG: DUF4317 domain-containing protein [Clostridium sp.]|nr:DUF4317 domain-containing protein [Clostridium sp.]
MNKKEVSELRRNFSPEQGLLVMNRVLTVVVNPNSDSGKVCYHNVSSGVTMSEYERDVYFETLKNVLSTKVGKKLVEYKFPNTAYGEGEPQNILYNIIQSGFTDAKDTESFIDQIVDNIDSMQPYTIISSHCTYTVFNKNKADETEKYSSEEYKFIITAICPIKSGDNTFAYNFANNEFISSKENKLVINKTPADGFIFPAFNDRSSDVNSVMYYCNKPKEPNVSVIEGVLGCDFRFSPDTEMEYYKTILKTFFENKLSYEIILAMENEIKMFIERNDGSTEIPMIYQRDFRNMLESVYEQFDLDEDKLTSFDEFYHELVGERVPLTAANLIDNKILIEANGVTLNIKDSDACRIESADSSTGRIIINITEPTYEINGMTIK